MTTHHTPSNPTPPPQYTRIEIRRLKELENSAAEAATLKVALAQLRMEFDNYKLLTHSIMDDTTPLHQATTTTKDGQIVPAMTPANPDGLPLNLLGRLTSDVIPLDEPSEPNINQINDLSTKGGISGTAPNISPIIKSKLPYEDLWAALLEVLSVQHHGLLSQPKHLSPSNVRIVMTAIEMGVTRKRSCAIVGITKANLDYYYRKRGANVEPYVSFFDLMELAEARTEVALVAAWRRHARDSWQAAQKLLETRFPDDWGVKQAITLTSQDLRQKTPAELADIAGVSLEEYLGQDNVEAIR